MNYIYGPVIVLVILGTLVIANSVRGELIVDPTGGTILMHGQHDLDPVVAINQTGTFGGLFYGQSVGAITVAENGNLNFSADNFFFPSALSQFPGVARIAPLWDDVLLADGANNQVIEHSVAGQYLGVTWKNVRLSNETSFDPPIFPDTDRSFQVLWFEAPTTIKGVLFNPNEIVFSYVGHVAGTSDFGPIFATTGITDGVNLFTTLPGDADGLISEVQSTLLAWESGSYLVFRPVVSGNTTIYEARKEFVTAVPEPSSIIVLSAILLGFGFRHDRLRSRQKAAIADPALLVQAN